MLCGWSTSRIAETNCSRKEHTASISGCPIFARTLRRGGPPLGATIEVDIQTNGRQNRRCPRWRLKEIGTHGAVTSPSIPPSRFGVSSFAADSTGPTCADQIERGARYSSPRPVAGNSSRAGL